MTEARNRQLQQGSEETNAKQGDGHSVLGRLVFVLELGRQRLGPGNGGTAGKPAAKASDSDATAKSATDPSEKKDDAKESIKLRYRFKLGETIRWSVSHRVKVRTSVAGSSQLAETETESNKVWRVQNVSKDGKVTFVHSVDWVRMVQRVTGRQDVVYDSRSDKRAPLGLERVASSVGVPLSVVVMDSTGKVIERRDRHASAPKLGEGQITLPMPEKPVSVGEKWKVPLTVNVRLKDGTFRKIKTVQTYKFLSVASGLAKIKVDTSVLTPVSNPEIEVQLIQQKTSGTVSFDIDAGRIVSQRVDLDERVYRFQGEASSMHYVSRFEEKLAKDSVRTATKPKAAGPQPLELDKDE